MSNDQNQALDYEYNLYSLHLKQIFDQIDYYISKKNNYYQEIVDYIKKFPKLLENDKKINLNADKYFPIIAKSLQYESYKITDCVLKNLKVLISNNFLLGNTKENDIITEPENEISEDRKIIDLIIETLCSLENNSYEEIWLETIEVLNEIIINQNIFLTKDNLIKILNFYFQIYSKIKNNNQNKDIEEKIKNLIKEYYIEIYNKNENFIIFPLDRKDTNMSTESYNNDILTKIYNDLRNKKLIENVLKYNPLDILICRIGKQMVDLICLQDAKGDLNSYNNYKVNSLIPKTKNDFNLPLYRKLSNIKLLNEYNYESGRFGWCYICRKKADYYCKDIKVPICSYKCKEILNQEENKMTIIQKKILIMIIVVKYLSFYQVYYLKIIILKK